MEHPRCVLNVLRRHYADRYVEWVANNFTWTEVRTGWRSQAQGIFFREWDKWSRWGLDNGLHSVLTQALMMGLIGYPYVLPDMIGGNAYATGVVFDVHTGNGQEMVGVDSRQLRAVRRPGWRWTRASSSPRWCSRSRRRRPM